MKAERSAVAFGTTTIGYAIRRSNRRKTVSIAVDAADGVVVTAPADVPVERLDRLVRSRGRWVLDHLRQVLDRPPEPSPREFLSGETFRYLGRQYRLRVRQGEAQKPALRGGWLEVGMPRGAGPAAVREALVGWYRQHAAERLPGVVARWARNVDAEVTEVVMAEPQRRWASCTAGRVIRINWRIIQAPPPVIDYVVAHEVCHIIHPDHSRAFWTLLGKVMPDYEARRERLRQRGSELVW